MNASSEPGALVSFVGKSLRKRIAALENPVYSGK